MSNGISLHIGLNRVDPSCYNGWDGALAGCINDARDMESISSAQGYSTTILLDEEATSTRVIEEIGRVAQQAASGDTFVLTYSGHGGQMPDENGDEELDQQDETWVLYDRQLVDDELYQLWSQFASGVRIFVLSDSCHSGTVAKPTEYRALMSTAAGAKAYGGKPKDPPKLKLLPLDTQIENYRSNRDLYRTVQWLAGRGDRSDVGASVLLISGCQDNQLSADGDGNGLFTATLKSVWDGGSFQGNYTSFHQQIQQAMPATQSPNLYIVGASNSDFEAEKPWTIASQNGQHDEEPNGGEQPATQPSVTGPSSLSRSDGPPEFSVTTGSNQYYIFEIATDSSVFEDYDHMTDANFYGSWNDSDAPARYTESSYTLPQAAWDRLKSNDSLTFRIGTTSTSDSWDNYQVSTAGTISVTGSETGGSGDETSTGPSVSGPEEWARNDPSPAFDVTLDSSKPYYIFEITSDESIFDNYDSATEDTFYATWQDSDAPARLTDSRYELPDAAWQRLKSHDTLCYRIGVTSTEDSWDDYAVSPIVRMQTVESRRPPSRKRGSKSTPPSKPADSDPFDTPGWTSNRPRNKDAYAKSAT